MDLGRGQNFREGLAKWYRNDPGSRRILMPAGLRSAGVCVRESSRDRCTYQREVGWGVARRYVPVVELDLLSGWVGGEVALSWDIAKGEVV